MNILWDKNLGQENAIEHLSKIINSNRIPHAFLFVGREGIGKHYAAVKFAQFINSSDELDENNPIVKRIESLSEPYVKFVFPLPRGKGESADDSPTEKLSQDQIEEVTNAIQNKVGNPYYKIEIEKASGIKINSIRDVRRFININYDEIKYRLILIEDAHLMNEEAQNALLKSLEEPPEGVIFILTTSDENRLLPTIKSRCWAINFIPLSNENLVYILTKYYNVEKDFAQKLTFFSDGSVLEALRLINSNFEETIEKVIDVLRYSLAKKYHSAYSVLNELFKDKKPDFIKQVITMLSRWFSDAQKERAGLDDFYFDQDKETFMKFNQKFKNTDINNLLVKLDELSNSVGRNVGLNMITTSIIFEISAIVMR